MNRLEQRLERIAAFFRLPHQPYDPVATVAAEGEGTWHRLSLAAWLMMYAALISTALVSADIVLTSILGVLLTVALPVAHRLHYRTTSRLLVNWITFGAAFLTGPIFLARYWPLRDGIVAGDNVEGMAFLVLCFMWITAFRAFAVRTVRDLVETILPCGSVILLTLVVRPTPVALVCMAITIMGALALLAAEHRVASRQTYHPLSRVVASHSSRRAGSFYSWPTLYVLVLVAAAFVAWGAARSELSSSWADELRFAMAQKIASWLAPRENAILPDPSVMLARLDRWPNTERTVFKVRAKLPGNYRVSVYHTYTGVWWQQGHSRMTRAVPLGGEKWNVPLVGSGAARQAATLSEQTFTAYKAMVGIIPSQFCPVQVAVRQRALRYDRDRLLRIPHLIRPGSSFTVTSYAAPIIPLAREGVEVDERFLQLDLGLPPQLPQRVRDLAREITRDAETPYERAHSIEQHLMWNYKYTLSVPSGYPNDFVDHFLFVTKKGFCHHFAGSMVIMCRAIGLPARLAGGYLRGEEDPDDPDLYTVREKDAHVWPEVYFKGAGWVAFEPTPAADDEPTGLAKAWKEIVDGTRLGGEQAVNFVRRHFATMVTLLLVAALALAGARWQVQQRHLRAFRGQEPLARITRAYVRMRRLLVQRGVPERPATAPRELLEGLPEPLWHVRQEAEALTENYLQARFGRGAPAATMAAAAEAQLRQVRREVRRRDQTHSPVDGPVAPESRHPAS